MAYQLKPGRSASKQLSRIVRREFAGALDEMDEARRQPEVVHDARKRLKKIRAILHLVRSPLGSAYRMYNKRLRTIAHQLSAPRDAHAAIETMAAVQRHYPKLVTRAILAGVRRGLMPKTRDASSRLRPARIQRELRHSAKTMPRRVRRATDPVAVCTSVVRGYSRARKAMRSVKATPEDVGFHAWRRRVKDHWYHVRLLEGVRPLLRTRVQRLKRLERWLGDDHNLVLLRSTLLNASSTFGDERAMAVVLGCIEKYQATLRTRALKLGEPLFAPTPSAFERSI